MRSLIAMYQRIGLVPLIIIGLVLGTLIGWLAPDTGIALGLLGTLFVGALKAVAPVLVFVLVIAAISQHRSGNEVFVKPVLIMYMFHRMLVMGDADMVVAGGVESFIDAVPIASFAMMRAMSTNNDNPAAASRPFDKDRDGFVFGEAGALMILETEEHAKARGATIHARLLGSGITSDGYHIVAPHPEGLGAARAMTRAIEMAGLTKSDIKHINAHATATPIGDIAEAKAINAAVGNHGLIDLSQCYHLTMDEADRMIDMGFEKALQSILSFLPSTSSSGFGLDSTIFKVKSRITLMFTATISPPIEKITKDYLQTPAYLYIGDAGEIVDNINQKFEYLGDNVDSQEELNAPRTNKMILALRQHIRETEQPLIIIFANFKRTCELLSVELSVGSTWF
ncbi:hypothetical protein CEK62_19560 [Alcanivorax sp. N3-2A]|nr:hypothetical protein CEK62_19560 [Alcanivorax sp. N3-2A]